MSQTQQVIEMMKALGGVATFGKLNSAIDFSTWKTKTPEASVRRIVQQSDAFIRVKPGLWALREYENEIFRKLNIVNRNDSTDKNDDEFSHSYYQGLAVEIGNLRDMITYIPGQDKNKLFLDKPLKDVALTSDIFSFTYPEIIRYAKTVDVIWFNERKLPDEDSAYHKVKQLYREESVIPDDFDIIDTEIYVIR